MSATDNSTSSLPSGYATHDEYFAIQYQQGGRTVYSIDLSLPQFVYTVEKPDPSQKLEGNRQIQLSRAKSFGNYVRERADDYVCPSMLFRLPSGELEFRDLGDSLGGATGATRFGVLSVPRTARRSLEILDGQHRALGFHLYWDDLLERIKSARGRVASAEREGDRSETRRLKRDLTKLLAERDRVGKDRVRLDIVVIDDPVVYRQVFVDIADNAKGISGSVRARFDSRKVVNRALREVMDHRLLRDRVEEESDRVTGTSLNWLAAKHVADLIRAVQIGTTGRMNARDEDELHQSRVERDAIAFLDLLEEAFSDLQHMMQGKMSPAELRQCSLLGSASMIRVIAGVYHKLTGVGSPRESNSEYLSRDEVLGKFQSLAPTLAAPLTADSPWNRSACFAEGAVAPYARQGDLNQLTRFLEQWIRTGEAPDMRPDPTQDAEDTTPESN